MRQRLGTSQIYTQFLCLIWVVAVLVFQCCMATGGKFPFMPVPLAHMKAIFA
jgi:hypothetical protein